MQAVSEFFKEGGFTMWVELGLFLVSLFLVAVAFIVEQRPLGLVVVGMAMLVLLTGVGGWLRGRSATDSAVAVVAPEHQALIREVGYRESARNLQLGVPLAAVAAALGAAAYARAMRKDGGAAPRA